jgi:hypothetical protein
MKVLFNKRLAKPYIVIWSDTKKIKQTRTCFKTIAECLDFACSQGEWCDGLGSEIKEYIVRNNHRMQQHAGYREFCDF